MNNEELMAENERLKAQVDILMINLHNRSLLEMEHHKDLVEKKLVRQLNGLLIKRNLENKE